MALPTGMTLNSSTRSYVPHSLAILPTELLVKIILELDWRSALRLQLVSSVFSDIVRNHVAVQYHVELGVSGMVDGPPAPYAPFNTDERLRRLRLYQSRWKHFEYTRAQTVRKVTGSIWELASGVLGQGFSANVSEHIGRTGVRKLLFTKLPSSARVDSRTREWTHGEYEFAIRDFTMNPTQDLLVLLRDSSNEEMNSAEIHLRSLCTNEKHPAAKLAVLVHGLHGGVRGRSHSLQICQNRLAILHKARAGHWPEKVVVYDWKQGRLLFEISFCGIMSFAFLSPNYLLFAVQPFNVMPACHGDHQPRLLVCDIDYTAALSPTGHPESYAAICELHFPELKQYADVVDILIRADPPPANLSPYSCVAQPANPNLSRQLPPAFSTSPENRLFVITLQVETVFEDMGDHRASETVNLGLFVPLSTFVPFISSSSPDAKEPDIIPANSDDEALYFGDFHARPPRRIAVPWQDWMQKRNSDGSDAGGVRALLIPDAEGVWVCNVFGSRCVYALEPRDVVVPLAPRHVAILDFNVDAVRRDRSRDRDRDQDRRDASSAPCSPRSSSDGHDAGASEQEGSANPVERQGDREGEGDRASSESDSDSSSSPSSSSSSLSSSRSLVEVSEYFEPNTLEASRYGIFEEDVTTSLPYRRTVLREKVRFHGVMLSEDNVIFVNQRAPREYEVLTF